MRTAKSSQTYVIKAADLSAGCHGNHNASFFFYTIVSLPTSDCVCAQGLGFLSLTKMRCMNFYLFIYLYKRPAFQTFWL